MTYVAGDLGGTKTLLALYDEAGNKLHAHRFASAGGALDPLLLEFLAQPAVRAHERPDRAALGVAGPVEDHGDRQTARITNLSWHIDSTALAAAAGLQRVLLVNDFYAVAAAAVHLDGLADSPARVTLNRGQEAPWGALAILGAGTGLGEAFVVRHGGLTRIVPSEGGHADFAPRDDVEIALLRFLQRRHGGHVSYERVLSGAGLLSLYEFYREHHGGVHAPDDLLGALQHDRRAAPALISAHALRGSDPICSDALERFVQIYGAEASNLALKVLGTGGVYVGGGIAPKILPRLRDGTFMEGFLQKGRFSGLCATIPVHVIVDPEAGLLGAAALAARL